MSEIVNVKFNDNIFKFNSIDSDWISKSWKSGCFYEEKLLKKILSLKITGAYVDCGAHHGNHSIFFEKICNASNVISIEGNPKNFTYLQQNLHLNNCKAITINKVISDIADKEYGFSYDTRNTGGSRAVNLENNIYNKETTTVNISNTLDNILSNYNDIGLIKMDIEGYEYLALLGGEKTIIKFLPTIVVEIHTKSKDNYNIRSFLEKIGYDTDNINYAATPTFIFTPRSTLKKQC
jgi:FkbM family methyltransferase